MTPVLRSLTLRQEAVLNLLAEGLTDKEIASRLGMSESGAKKHVGEIIRRLNAENRTHAVALYVRARVAA